MSETKKNLLPQVFEPLAIVAILGLFLIPTLTVINLSPITQENKQINVLGATSSPHSIDMEILNENDEIFVSDTLRKKRDGEYVYSAEVGPRKEEKEYSKPAFRITNRSSTRQTLVVDGYADRTSPSNFSLKIDGGWYVLRDGSKEMYKREIVLEPNATKTVYISTYSDSNILFKEVFTISISTQ